jgi:3-mercaptopyruvate sulfurtransferase SseA
LLTGAINFPWLSVGAGALYMISTMSRAKELFKDNGVQAAKKSISRKVRSGSVTTLKLLAFASIAKMAMDNFDLSLTDFVNR